MQQRRVAWDATKLLSGHSRLGKDRPEQARSDDLARVQRNGDPAATGRVPELSMGTPLDNDHPAQSAESLHYLSTGYALASRGQYAAGLTIVPTLLLGSATHSETNLD
jgi:hypothetical protein